MIFRCYGSPFSSARPLLGLPCEKATIKSRLFAFISCSNVDHQRGSALNIDFFRVGSMSTFQCMFASWTLFGFDNARKLCNWKRFPSCRVSAQDVTQNWLSRIVSIVTCELKEGLPGPTNHSISKYFDALPEIQRPMWPCLEACKLHLHQ